LRRRGPALAPPSGLWGPRSARAGPIASPRLIGPPNPAAQSVLCGAVFLAALPVSADAASGSGTADTARVALVWACPDLLPAPGSGRVLRAGGRVKDRAGSPAGVA